MVYTSIFKENFDLRPLGRILDGEEPGDDEIVAAFWLQKQVFVSERHQEMIEPCNLVAQAWRMKERQEVKDSENQSLLPSNSHNHSFNENNFCKQQCKMKTVSVALVLCLNVGVDPPDTVKVSPCARQQCWIDPHQFGDPCNGTGTQKPIEVIGAALQKQYERWQPRARYKLSLDPTVDDVKKLCMSLRRNAKDERVLLHYNGHGVPRPTPNGEIWVFNKHYTQYIPLSVRDLQMWMGSPSIYVFDCSNAGNVVQFIKNPPPVSSLFTNNEAEGDHLNETDVSEENTSKVDENATIITPGSCILLAACQANEILPLNPELPADLFTACLTTPIKIALKWYVLSRNSKLVPHFTMDLADQIPGQLNDRRTMLGELNWIFTAITDTIAWNVLSKELFQKLFRQDLLVASLFRNFLLAERILDYYNCNPISLPQLPSTRHHPMWLAWDYALDGVLQQLPNVLENPSSFQHSSFFSDQLTGFEVWLQSAISLKVDDDTMNQGNLGSPDQLPIVLQVLLSQVHRQRALDLLGKFLNLGQWAVNLALSVGIFPYVLKLLQSSARELKSLLVFIWAKLLAVDISCQTDLVKDNGHKYFLDVLSDPTMEPTTRMTAAFVLALMVDNYRNGQIVAVNSSIISTCLLLVTDPHPGLRKWVTLCLSKVWLNYDEARWIGVRDSAHEKLFPLLLDPIPEVRAAAVYCLGTFLSNTTERDEHVNKIDNTVASSLLVTTNDASPLVRKELVMALSGFLTNFSPQFEKIAAESSVQKSYHHTVTGQDALISKDKFFRIPRSNSASDLTVDDSHEMCNLKHISTASPLHGMRSNSTLNNVWNALLTLKQDPHSAVSSVATRLCDDVARRANTFLAFLSAAVYKNFVFQKRIRTHSNKFLLNARHDSSIMLNGPRRNTVADNLVCFSLPSQFFAWCCRQFAESKTKPPTTPTGEEKIVGSKTWMCGDATSDRPGSMKWYDRDFRYNRAARVIKSSEKEQLRTKFSKLDELTQAYKFNDSLGILRFHPYESQLAIVEETTINIYDWERNMKISSFSNRNMPHTRTTHLNFLNPHDDTLLLSGTDDGLVRVWKNYTENDPELVTSWTALNNLLPMSNSPGLVMEWDEKSQVLYACGNASYIRLWDVNTELKIRDVSVSSGGATTSISVNNLTNNIFVGGFADSSVRIFDKRMTHNDCEVKCFRRHKSRIHKVCCLQGFENLLISASNKGEVFLWDLRNQKYLDAPIPSQSCELKAFDIHQRADLFVCSYSGQQSISAFNHAGKLVCSIKSHQGIMPQGFMTHKNGAFSHLAFHPHKVKLAVASENNVLSLSGLSDGKKR